VIVNNMTESCPAVSFIAFSCRFIATSPEIRNFRVRSTTSKQTRKRMPLMEGGGYVVEGVVVDINTR
jgi:hypothetical protein